MLPAPDLKAIRARMQYGAGTSPLRERLVSIVFASPQSLVFKDIRENYVLWNAETGEHWDLYFAGYYAYAGQNYDPAGYKVFGQAHGHADWWFSPRKFRELLDEVQRAHAEARVTADFEYAPYRFSGRADLVSVMEYEGEFDWPSLKAATLTDTHGNYLPSMSTGEIVERFRRWRSEDDEVSLKHFPGQVPLGSRTSVHNLTEPLQWTALAASAGVLGNAAFELLRRLADQR